MEDIVLEVVLKLNEIRQQYGGDGIKVYLNDDNNYCIKVIKNEKPVKVFRYFANKKRKCWDIKEK